MTLRVAVLGGGSFGTALAHLATHNGCDSVLWSRDDRRVLDMQLTGENRHYLPGHTIHEDVRFTSCLQEAVEGAAVILIAIPSSSFREVVQQFKGHANSSDTILVSGTKGIEAGSFNLMSEILEQEMPDNPRAVLSGPNLAIEIMQQKLAGSVVAASDYSSAKKIRDTFCSPTFQLYYNEDIRGVQIAGALKNIYALMAGYMEAQGFGDNAVSTLLTRALAEMTRLGAALGAKPSTFQGLAGMGDLIATCNSRLSRNFHVGFLVGNGQSPDEALAGMGQTVEGLNTLELVYEKKQELGVQMPLVDVIWDMWQAGGKSLTRLMAQWRSGELLDDVDFASTHMPDEESKNKPKNTQKKQAKKHTQKEG